MSQNRKLKTEIARTLKKVAEGIEIFEEMWDKVYSASDQSQKEKYSVELKKELKKLQRCRDQIKTWISNSAIKDKRELSETRRLIETKMEQFKECEKEVKTKAYSKEGLAQAEEIDPEDEARNECTKWVQEYATQLEQQVEALEADLEVLQSQKRPPKGEVRELEEKMRMHQWHIEQLETVLRLVRNKAMEPEEVEAIKDDVDYYVTENSEPDFYPDDSLYEQLELDERSKTSLHTAKKEKALAAAERAKQEREERAAAAAKKAREEKERERLAKQREKDREARRKKAEQQAAQKKLREEALAKQKKARQEAMLRQKQQGAASNHSMATMLKSGGQKGEQMKQQQQQNLRHQQQQQLQQQQLKQQKQPFQQQQSQQQNQKQNSQLSESNKSSLPPQQAGAIGELTSKMGELSASDNNTSTSGASKFQLDSQALNMSLQFLPRPGDSECVGKYRPQNPVQRAQISQHFPQAPAPVFDNLSVFEKMDTDVLFFIFYHQQGTYQQFLAARELKKQSWRFHKKYMTWFQRHEEPKVTTDEYEQGTYVYFDYETGWYQRIKSEFTFEYSYLEDDLAV